MNTSHLFKRLDWVTTPFFLLTPLGALVLAPFYWGELSLAICLFFIGSAVLSSLAITGGYHRLFAHRSYEAKAWVRLCFLLFGAAAVQGSAIKWCTDHRRHHRFVDTEQDPYNIKRGFFFAHVGWILFKESPGYQEKFEEDLLSDRWLSLQHRFYVPLVIIMGFLLPFGVGLLVGNPMAYLVWGGLTRIVFTQHCTFFVNSACHYFGWRPYSDKFSARDNPLAAFFTYGEGYHNYHHQFSSDYRNGFKWYHWDPTKWSIRVLSYFGWAYHLKSIPSWEILRTRIQMEQKRLLQRGIPEERLLLFKQKLEEAQGKWKNLAEDYRKFKKNMATNSKHRLIQLKAERKIARLEFKLACRQWAAYVRALRGLPVIQVAVVK